MYAWEDLTDELREDVEADLERGLTPATLGVGYDGPLLAMAMQGPLFCLEDAEAIIDRYVDVFSRFTTLRRFAATWPARFELDGPEGDELRSSDGGIWALLITRGVLDDRDRATWRCSLLGYRFDRATGSVEVSDEEGAVDIATMANPFPRRLRAVLAPGRHERRLADPYLDTRTLERDGYDLAMRPDFGAEQMVPVDDQELTWFGGKVWPTATLS